MGWVVTLWMLLLLLLLMMMAAAASLPFSHICLSSTTPCLLPLLTVAT
jgi:hypothetical protein